MNKLIEIRDKIPRLQQLVPHMRDQLSGLNKGATFEQCRLRYGVTVDRLVAQGLGRRTASRVGDKDRYWAPTRDVLDEAMRLGFVERQQLPSARKYVDVYRDREFRLTSLGYEAAEQAENDIAAFSDRLAVAVYSAHPYFQKFVHILEEGPLTCPETTEGDIEESRHSGMGTEYWINHVTEQLKLDELSREQEILIRKVIISVVRNRFGRSRDKRPTNKEMSEALNDAFIEVAIELRGLNIGATALKVLKGWGSQLRLLDQSRYVPQYKRQNVIWLAADLDANGDLQIQRRTYDRHEREVAEAVISAYRSQALVADSKLSSPYIPIYRVRAEAAFHCKVTRALVNLVLERLASGNIPELDVQIWLHLGTTRQPPSEPVYRRGGNRRYEMTLKP